MELSVLYSRALSGLDAPLVQVETHLANGLPAFHIVGLPEMAVRESKDRVRSAIINSCFEFPDRRITVNLAPADLPKEGGRFDLAIALGILTASGQLPANDLALHEFLAELALDGSLRAVRGSIASAIAATGSGRRLVLAQESAGSAAQVPGSKIIPAADILTLCAHLNGRATLQSANPDDTLAAAEYPDMADVVGQAAARRAMEIAAAGGHNLLFCGPPGTGKTLLASRLPGILPPPRRRDVLYGLALQDIEGLPAGTPLRLQRPFRCPHHSATATSLTGGGGSPRPGEVSLAHGGVLFLDELPEFNRRCLESLREPMESGEITLTRTRHRVTYPARFQLVAAMNPCPCGFLGDPERSCRCRPEQVQRYRARLSGPLLDRIDLHVTVPRLPPSQLLSRTTPAEASAPVQARVTRCREIQQARQGCSNAGLASASLHSVCQLGEKETRHLSTATQRMHLSARGLHRSLRVARTIADLEQENTVSAPHLAEALAYRQQAE